MSLHFYSLFSIQYIFTNFINFLKEVEHCVT